MSTNDAHQRCMMCRAIGFVLAAIVVGLITWWLTGLVPVWLALIAFLGLLALGLWLVVKYCGDPGEIATGAVTGAAVGGATAAAAMAGTSGSDDMAADADAAAAEARAQAEREASEVEARAKADAEAAEAARVAEAEGKAEAEAAEAREKAQAEAEAARAREEAAEAEAKALADAQAREEEAAEAARQRAAEEASSSSDAGADDTSAASEAASAEAAAKAAAMERARAVASTSPADNGGSPSSPGIRPAALDGPRDGGADDLKKIKGVGPKLEKLLNSMGFYHFDQVAAWTSDEVAWVDDNLEGFKGRVTRDEWVEQARLLATGGETAFSKKVDEGDVY